VRRKRLEIGSILARRHERSRLMSAGSKLRAGAPWQYGRAFACAVVVLAVCAAALLAHVGIDIAGDRLLAHDAYDDVAHGSRTAAFAGGLFVFAGLVLRLLCAGLDQARGAGTTLRRAIEPAIGRSPWRFVAFVVALSPAMLAGMEGLDTSLAGGRIDDLGDLFGGSFALGFGILVPTAALAAGLIWRLLRAIADADAAIVRALYTLFIWRAPGGSGLLGSIWREIAPPRSASPPAHRAGTRAPPLALT
jgi:hypothetical protein